MSHDLVQRKLIGIVDNERNLVKIFTETLSRIEGYSVIGFTDSNIALNHIKTSRANYALLLSELKTVGMTGIELLRESKKLNPSIVCILMSEFDPNSDPGFVLSVKEKFIDGFIEKPVDTEQLLVDIKGKLHIS